METTEAPGGVAIPRPRIANACEACRSAKVKCQASNQLGICKRCLDSKRECIYKTGPRTRRPRQKKTDPSATTNSSIANNSNNSNNNNNNNNDNNINNDNDSNNKANPTRRAPTQAPPPRPSKTFTIDIPMPADDDVTDSFDSLRLTHENSVDGLVPFISSEDEDADADGGAAMDYDWLNSDGQASACGSSVISSHASSLPVGASAFSTPPSSISHGLSRQQKARSRMVASLGLQPQFNLDSAGKLLSTFTRVMLDRFHCVTITESDTVASLAQVRPFVLLAVLAAASGSRTLQGHSLYDEEFRKILGLKYVAGGERSLELLQGLVVYVAWYPFHLRPKSKQALQYIRMAVDIVSDLELDQDPQTDFLDIPPPPSRLDEIRTYMACYYLASSFASTWGRTPSLLYNAYTTHCCDVLERHSTVKGDRILVWKVRLQRLIEQTNDLRRTNRGHSQSEIQIDLMIRGMEAQLTEWEGRMAPEISSASTIRLAVLFTRIFLSGAPLLKLPSVKLPALDSSSTFRADPARLQSSIPILHASYEYYISLPAEEINAFTGVEWSGFILSVILGFRMSFPLIVCPEWDGNSARALLKFEDYLGRMCRMGSGGEGGEDGITSATLRALAGEKAPMDVLSASKVVLGVVKKKFMKKVAKIEGVSERQLQLQQQLQQQQQQQTQQVARQMAQQVQQPVFVPAVTAHPGNVSHDSATEGCPMMDGSLENYYHIWDETFSNGLNMGSAGGGVSSTTAAGNPNLVAVAAHPGQVGTCPMQHGQAQPPVVYNDLWAAINEGWAAQGGREMGFGGV